MKGIRKTDDAAAVQRRNGCENEMICSTLEKVVKPMGHEVRNYGMYSADDACQLTYVQVGILAAVLLNSGAADYVITGCGTGEEQCWPATLSPV